MLARTATEILIILSVITLGSSLVCYQCVGNSCDADPKGMATCNSDEFCYLTKNGEGETRGCESQEGCTTSRARRGGQFQHYISINGNHCQICNQRLCNGGSQVGTSRVVECYKCEGDECKGDEENLPTCESSICFFARADGVEKRGCGTRPVIQNASSALQVSCTYDKCNNEKGYEQTQKNVIALQQQMNNLGRQLKEDQMRMQQNMETQMKNMGETMSNNMKNMFANIRI